MQSMKKIKDAGFEKNTKVFVLGKLKAQNTRPNRSIQMRSLFDKSIFVTCRQTD